MYTIETRNLTKRFEQKTAVEGLTLQVEAGEVYGFLGPNGAGKSTTIAMLLDYVRPTSGDVTIAGCDARTEQRELRRRVGVVPERCQLARRATAREHLRFAVRSHETSDEPRKLLARTGLGHAADEPVRTFSTGMAQRLRLAMALVGDPAVLLLDEPASGLDPTGQRELRELLRAEAMNGTTVFFSSHHLDQVAAIADRIGMLVDGRLEAEGTPAELGDSGVGGVRIEARDWKQEWSPSLADLPGVASISIDSTRQGERLDIELQDEAGKPAAIDFVTDRTRVDSITEDESGLATTFARVTGADRCK